MNHNTPIRSALPHPARLQSKGRLNRRFRPAAPSLKNDVRDDAIGLVARLPPTFCEKGMRMALGDCSKNLLHRRPDAGGPCVLEAAGRVVDGSGQVLDPSEAAAKLNAADWCGEASLPHATATAIETHRAGFATAISAAQVKATGKTRSQLENAFIIDLAWDLTAAVPDSLPMKWFRVVLGVKTDRIRTLRHFAKHLFMEPKHGLVGRAPSNRTPEEIRKRRDSQASLRPLGHVDHRSTRHTLRQVLCPATRQVGRQLP